MLVRPILFQPDIHLQDRPVIIVCNASTFRTVLSGPNRPWPAIKGLGQQQTRKHQRHQISFSMMRVHADRRVVCYYDLPYCSSSTASNIPQSTADFPPVLRLTSFVAAEISLTPTPNLCLNAATFALYCAATSCTILLPFKTLSARSTGVNSRGGDLGAGSGAGIDVSTTTGRGGGTLTNA